MDTFGSQERHLPGVCQVQVVGSRDPSEGGLYGNRQLRIPRYAGQICLRVLQAAYFLGQVPAKVALDNPAHTTTRTLEDYVPYTAKERTSLSTAPGSEGTERPARMSTCAKKTVRPGPEPREDLSVWNCSGPNFRQSFGCHCTAGRAAGGHRARTRVRRRPKR